jgi:antitoxin ParD1/3/4
MSVTLSPQTEALIRRKLEAGRYATVDDVITEALRVLDARDRRIEQMRESVRDGFAAIERGEGIELTAESMTERGRRAQERVQHGDVPSPDVCP